MDQTKKTDPRKISIEDITPSRWVSDMTPISRAAAPAILPLSTEILRKTPPSQPTAGFFASRLPEPRKSLYIAGKTLLDHWRDSPTVATECDGMLARFMVYDTQDHALVTAAAEQAGAAIHFVSRDAKLGRKIKLGVDFGPSPDGDASKSVAYLVCGGEGVNPKAIAQLLNGNFSESVSHHKLFVMALRELASNQIHAGQHSDKGGRWMQ